jgi:hypothetical protein
MRQFSKAHGAAFFAVFALFFTTTVFEREARAFIPDLASELLIQDPPAEGRRVREIGKPPVEGLLPECLTFEQKPMALDNLRVLDLKRNTRNQHKDRGYVEGTVSRMFGRKGDHLHFEVLIGNDHRDGIEIVYNRDFGNPRVEPGDHVIACGDYITSYAKAGGYEASPSKALIHWVHENERGTAHPDGFIVVNRTDLYGYGQKAYSIRIAQ